MLERVRRGDGDGQRARVGVADVLGREDDHAPGDEARILAALEHRRQVVDGRVGVAAAHGLDEGGDEVVVLVARAVVLQRALAGGVLDVPRCELGSLVLAPWPRPARASTARCARRPRRAGRSRPPRRRARSRRAPRRRGAARASTSSSDSASSSNTAQRESSAELTSKYGFSVVAPMSVTSPLSTAGRSASCCALLKRWISSRKRMRALPRAAQAVARALDDPAHVVDPRADRRELLEGGPRRLRDDARERRLADARRPVEDHRRGTVALDRAAERRARSEDVALPRRARRATAAGSAAREARLQLPSSAAASAKRSLMGASMLPSCPAPVQRPSPCSPRVEARASRPSTASASARGSSRATDGPPAWHDDPRVAGGGDQAPPGPDPPRHRQPAGQRDARGRGAPRLPRAQRHPVRARREGAASARTWSLGWREVTGRRSCSRSHTDTVRADADGVGARPVVGRPRGRRGLGARGAGHEEPRRCEHGRLRVAVARGLPAGGRRRARAHRRRGGRRGLRARVARSRASRHGARRLRAERGGRRAVRARRPPGLRVRGRREGERAVPRRRARPQRPRLGARGSPTTRS